jgi:hypothetical protein
VALDLEGLSTMKMTTWSLTLSSSSRYRRIRMRVRRRRRRVRGDVRLRDRCR